MSRVRSKDTKPEVLLRKPSSGKDSGSACTEETFREPQTSFCRNSGQPFSFMAASGISMTVKREACRKHGRNGGKTNWKKTGSGIGRTSSC
jgi:hypothetical protein